MAEHGDVAASAGEAAAEEAARLAFLAVFGLAKLLVQGVQGGVVFTFGQSLVAEASAQFLDLRAQAVDFTWLGIFLIEGLQGFFDTLHPSARGFALVVKRAQDSGGGIFSAIFLMVSHGAGKGHVETTGGALVGSGDFHLDVFRPPADDAGDRLSVVFDADGLAVGKWIRCVLHKGIIQL